MTDGGRSRELVVIRFLPLWLGFFDCVFIFRILGLGVA